MTDELTSHSLCLAGKSQDKRKKHPVSSYSNYDYIFSSNSDLIMLRVWIAILIIPSWKCSEREIGAAGRRSSYLCRVANVWTFYFMWNWRGRRFLVSIKKNPKPKVSDRQQKWAWGTERKEGVKERKWVSTESEILEREEEELEERGCVCVCVCVCVWDRESEQRGEAVMRERISTKERERERERKSEEW